MANMGQKGVFWGVNSWTMWIEWMRVWPGVIQVVRSGQKGVSKGVPFWTPFSGEGHFGVSFWHP